MKKFIVTISAGWYDMKFEFSKQDKACKFMGEAVTSSVGQVTCKLEVEEITNEETENN